MTALLKAWTLVLVGAVASFASDVQVTLRDGEVVEGRVSVSRWKIEADRRTTTLRAEDIVEIELGSPDVLRTSEGDELTGEVQLRTLRVRLKKGSRTLRRDEIARIVFVREGEASSAGGFTGRWSGSFGPMKLEQRGSRVQGTYGFDDEFSIEGDVQGKRLQFTYREPSASGSGWFELWEDDETFQGEFTAAGSSEPRAWGAYRIQHRAAPPMPGQLTEGQSHSALNYYLRVPKSYDGKRTYPAIAFFHGSNMSSKGYVATMASLWPKLAEDYILIGFDGERLSSASRPGRRVFNATYVNFSGHEKWHKWAYRQTPALAAEALDELKETLPIEHFFVGGHSQGGFLTFAIAMFYPEKIAGAFPMSGNLLVQCEPDAFTDAAVRAAQRRLPIAIVHGQKDNVVDFSSGQYCHERFVDEGFPMLKLFAPERVGHVFDHLPVEAAVRWLEQMASTDAKSLVRFAGQQLKAREYRDAMAALHRAASANGNEDERKSIASLTTKIDAAAQPRAEALEKTMRDDSSGDWAADFWEFRNQFALVPAAQSCLETFARLRERQAAPAQELFYAARQEKDDRERMAKYRELLKRYPASKWVPLVQRWVK